MTIEVEGAVEKTKNFYKVNIKDKDSGVFGTLYIPKSNDAINDDTDAVLVTVEED